jgi:hypothetical protein
VSFLLLDDDRELEYNALCTQHYKKLADEFKEAIPPVGGRKCGLAHVTSKLDVAAL